MDAEGAGSKRQIIDHSFSDEDIGGTGDLDIRADLEIAGQKLNVIATGLIAAIVAEALATYGILFLGDPMGKPGHFVATLITVFIGGICVGTSMMAFHLRAAMEEKIYYRKEVNRLSDERSALQAQILENRFSSRRLPDKSAGTQKRGLQREDPKREDIDG